MVTQEAARRFGDGVCAAERRTERVMCNGEWVNRPIIGGHVAFRDGAILKVQRGYFKLPDEYVLAVGPGLEGTGDAGFRGVFMYTTSDVWLTRFGKEIRAKNLPAVPGELIEVGFVMSNDTNVPSKVTVCKSDKRVIGGGGHWGLEAWQFNIGCTSNILELDFRIFPAEPMLRMTAFLMDAWQQVFQGAVPGHWNFGPDLNAHAPRYDRDCEVKLRPCIGEHEKTVKGAPSIHGGIVHKVETADGKQVNYFEASWPRGGNNDSLYSVWEYEIGTLVDFGTGTRDVLCLGWHWLNGRWALTRDYLKVKDTKKLQKEARYHEPNELRVIARAQDDWKLAFN